MPEGGRMSQYLLKITMALLMTLLTTFITTPTWCAIIFSDNFDAVFSGWNCYDDTPPGWSGVSDCGSASYGGVTHYGGEITAGGRTGNSLKSWKQGQFPSDASYYGLLNYDFGTDTYRDVYMRWYMKIPPGFNMTGFDYLKLWRWNFGAGVSYDKEIYLNFNAEIPPDDWSNAQVQVYNANGDGQWATMVTVADLPRDGQWHCYEWRVQLNTTGSSNGVLQFWLDGVLKYSATNVNYGATTTDYLRRTSLGTGNRNSGSAFQTAWQAIEFDDYVLSTTYVGCDSVAPTPTPSPSQTTGSSGGGGCFIATAAFGSPMEPAVMVFRTFRDEILMDSSIGKDLVAFYQRTSPPFADCIRRHDSARQIVRACLLPLAGFCWLLLAIGPFNMLILGVFLILLIIKKNALLNALQSSCHQSFFRRRS